MLGQQRIGFCQLDEVIMIERQLQKLHIYRFAGFIREDSEFLQEGLMLGEGCLVGRNSLLAHFKYRIISKDGRSNSYDFN